MAGIALSSLAVAGASLGGYLLGKKSSRKSKRERDAFQLVIWKEFKNVEDRDKFLDLFRPLGKYVSENEPGTLAYEISIADNNPAKILLFERYVSKKYFSEVHCTSKPYQDFKAAVSAAGIEFLSGGGQSYIETNLGYF